MASKREYVQPFLHLMLRDDILGWHASKTQAVSGMEWMGQQGKAGGDAAPFAAMERVVMVVVARPMR